jgi:hypothetical protein
MASEYSQTNRGPVPVGGLTALIDGKKLKPNCWYIVEGGQWVEVDYTDKVFSRVLSRKKGVLRVKTDKGKVLYLVTDDQGNSAHGETIKAARADLIYKVVTKFEGNIPKKATGADWVGIYRAVTGACADGVKHFVEIKQVDLAATYTAAQVVKMVAGSFGADKFAKKVDGRR